MILVRWRNKLCHVMDSKCYDILGNVSEKLMHSTIASTRTSCKGPGKAERGSVWEVPSGTCPAAPQRRRGRCRVGRAELSALRKTRLSVSWRSLWAWVRNPDTSRNRPSRRTAWGSGSAGAGWSHARCPAHHGPYCFSPRPCQRRDPPWWDLPEKHGENKKDFI